MCGDGGTYSVAYSYSHARTNTCSDSSSYACSDTMAHTSAYQFSYTSPYTRSDSSPESFAIARSDFRANTSP